MNFPIRRARLRLAYFLPSVTLAFASFLLGFNSWVACVLGIMAWLISCTGSTGVEISPDFRQSREYTGFLGWRLGSWQPLAPVVGVTLKYFSELDQARTVNGSSWGIWNNMPRRHEELIVMLSLQRSATGLILAYFGPDDVNVAIDFAHDTAERFRVPVNQYLPAHLYQPLPPASGAEKNC
jgi:hypothetical protein